MYRSSISFIMSSALLAAFPALAQTSPQHPVAPVTGIVIPPELKLPNANHWVCFPVTDGGNTQPQRTVNLNGPMGNFAAITVQNITRVCAMTAKTYKDSTAPIADKNDPYLVCYAIKPGDARAVGLDVSDQFGPHNNLRVQYPREICLPANGKPPHA